MCSKYGIVCSVIFLHVFILLVELGYCSMPQLKSFEKAKIVIISFVSLVLFKLLIEISYIIFMIMYHKVDNLPQP